jgi:hypothetical protein
VSWPGPANSSSIANITTDLGPVIIVPAGSTNFVLKTAGNGGIGDTIKAIRFRNSGPATTVTIKDGDGTPYLDPQGSGNLVTNPYNNRQIQGANAPTSVPDYLMFNQPSYSGVWTVTTAANAELEVFGTFS